MLRLRARNNTARKELRSPYFQQTSLISTVEWTKITVLKTIKVDFIRAFRVCKIIVDCDNHASLISIFRWLIKDLIDFCGGKTYCGHLEGREVSIPRVGCNQAREQASLEEQRMPPSLTTMVNYRSSLQMTSLKIRIGRTCRSTDSHR